MLSLHLILDLYTVGSDLVNLLALPCKLRALSCNFCPKFYIFYVLFASSFFVVLCTSEIDFLAQVHKVKRWDAHNVFWSLCTIKYNRGLIGILISIKFALTCNPLISSIRIKSLLLIRTHLDRNVIPLMTALKLLETIKIKLKFTWSDKLIFSAYPYIFSTCFTVTLGGSASLHSSSFRNDPLFHHFLWVIHFSQETDHWIPKLMFIVSGRWCHFSLAYFSVYSVASAHSVALVEKQEKKQNLKQ